jgi:hypothetical protein
MEASGPRLLAGRSARPPVLLAAVLLVVLAYAAFAHGAVQSPTEPRLQVAIAAIVAAAGASWLWSGTLRISAPALAVTGAGMLAAFVVWSGVTVLWSVAPDRTWIEFNRALTYVIVLGLAIGVGASYKRSVELVAKGFLLVALAVTVYALGQKLIPGLHIAGLFDLNQTGVLPRLQEPFGYWNALALFLVMGTPMALACVVDTSAGVRLRLAALLALELMLLTVCLTFSRGGLLALVVALSIWVAFSGARLRSLMWLGASCLATVAPAAFGLTSHSLTTAGASLGQREIAGGELTALVLVSLLVLVAAGRRLLELERTVHVGPLEARRITRSLLAGSAAVLVVVLLLVTLSGRGLTGTVSHAWSSFTATRGTTSAYDPHRLLSADSENRWVWWKEAAGAFSDRPIGGWGAGSFRVVHLLYRRDTISVLQPHSVPLQLLAETGLIGALLVMGGYALLFSAGVRTVRRRLAPGPERLLGGALLAAAFAYAFHTLYDWDWDIPGVTLPALVFLGVLAGAGHRQDVGRPPQTPAPGAGMRVIALGALGLMASLFALSAVLPSLAASKAGSAVVAASSSSSSELARAQASAQLASNLDPLSDAGLLAEATIAIHRGQPRQAQADLIQAIRRQPSDAQAWQRLAAIESFLGNVDGISRAAHQVVALDPRGPNGSAVLQRLSLLTVPPSKSATAQPIPLPAGTG